MAIINAVNRLYWRFGGNGNKYPFPVNNKDIEAYNIIKDHILQSQKKQFEKEELFAKLYIYLYMKILQNDQTTVMDNRARKKIFNLLKKPLYQIVEEFQKSLNDSEQYGILETIQEGKIKHPATQTETEKEASQERLKIILEDPKNKDKFMGEVWDYETVLNLVEAEVNQAINTFKNTKKNKSGCNSYVDIHQKSIAL